MANSLYLPTPSEPLVRVCELSKSYGRRGGLLHRPLRVQALKKVSLELLPGRTLAIVGESGSGKSTLARCIARLEKPDRGEVWLGGTNIAAIRNRRVRPFRTQIQLIFQDAATALNPRFSAAELIAEPLMIQGWGTKDYQYHRVRQLMTEVGLSADWADRKPPQFSGGQRQRLAIARAIVLRPKLLILDEALSSLDISTQAEIANLLLELQETYTLTYLLISHDISLVGRMADDLAVMYRGEIVERGPTKSVFREPQHLHTKALLDATRLLETKPGPRTEVPV